MTDEQIKTQKERCVPVAKKIVKLLGNADINVGSSREEILKATQPVVKEALKDLLEANLFIEDIEAIQTLIKQPQESFDYILVETMNKHMENLQEKVFKKSPKDFTMKELDDWLSGVLTAPLIEEKPKKTWWQKLLGQ